MEVPTEEMVRHTAEYIKQQTQLSLEDAVACSMPSATEKYVTSESVVRSARGYHHNDSAHIKKLLLALYGQGVDVVDDVEEDIYRCVMNIEEDGDDIVTVAHAKKGLASRGNGRLSKLNLGHDGVLSNQYGGLAAFQSLLKKHGLQ